MKQISPIIVCLAIAATACSDEATAPARDTGFDWQKAWCEKTPPKLDNSEFKQVVALFEQSLAPKADITALTRKWVARGFTLQQRTVETHTVWLISDAPGNHLGRGVYMIRRGTALPLLFQSPHSKADLRTGEIVSGLFKQYPARAACWNTCHRKRQDMSHTENTYFQAFTKAFASRFPDSSILQLHGFAAEKRTTEEGRTADIIISSGSGQGSLVSQKLARTLNDAGLGQVRLFPNEVSELGGTTNVQGRMLRRMGYLKFIHIEMNASTRKKAVSDPVVLKTLGAACIARYKALDKEQSK